MEPSSSSESGATANPQADSIEDQWICAFLAVVEQPVLVTDEQGLIRRANLAFVDQFGPIVENRMIADFIPTLDLQTIRELQEESSSRRLSFTIKKNAYTVQVRHVTDSFLFAISHVNVKAASGHESLYSAKALHDAGIREHNTPVTKSILQTGWQWSEPAIERQQWITSARKPEAQSSAEVQGSSQRTSSSSFSLKSGVDTPTWATSAISTWAPAIDHESSGKHKKGHAELFGSPWKTSWLESTAHMIRTYVNGILGMTQLLASTNTTPEQQTYCKELRTPAEALVNVVSDLIDCLEVAEGKINHEASEFSLRNCVETAMEAIARSTIYQQERAAFEAASYLEPKENWDVKGDQALIKRIVIIVSAYLIETSENLAVLLLYLSQEVTDEFIFVSFEMRALTRDNTPCKLRDNIKPCEPGFEEESTQIFKLWLARRLVVELKGETSMDHNTSTLRFRIPLHHPRRNVDQPNLMLFDPKEFIMKPTVMIIEPMAALCELYERYMAAWGFRVIVVDGLEQAEQTLKSRTCMVSFVLLSMQASSFDDCGWTSRKAGFEEPLPEVEMPFKDGAADESQQSEGASKEPPHSSKVNSMFAKVLEMKLDCFHGVSVIVMTPFRDHADFRLYERDAFAWQVLSKPCGMGKLSNSLSTILSDSPTERMKDPTTVIRRFDSERTELSHATRDMAINGPTPFRILIVDNHPVNQKLLVWMVESSSAPERPQPICDLADNGVHACDCVVYSEYDLVLMDMNMPGMTGMEATSEIRKMERTGELSSLGRRVPIVGMSATTRKFTPEEYQEMGMDDFLPWPVDRAAVDGVIRAYSEQCKAHRPPILNVDEVFKLCDGNYYTAFSMLDEFVRTSLLQVGMLRNWLIIAQAEKLHETTEAIHSTAFRIGAFWLKRAISEFARTLRDMPAYCAPTRAAAKVKVTQKSENTKHSLQLRLLANVEAEILSIGGAVDVIRSRQGGASRLKSIIEEQASEVIGSETFTEGSN